MEKAWIETRKGVDGKIYYCVIGRSPVVADGIVLSERLNAEDANEDLEFFAS